MTAIGSPCSPPKSIAFFDLSKSEEHPNRRRQSRSERCDCKDCVLNGSEISSDDDDGYIEQDDSDVISKEKFKKILKTD
jgi:hypothetical protein